MRKTYTVLACLMLHVVTAWAGGDITIYDITHGKYAAETMRSLTPLADGKSFARISEDGGSILKYDFTTGEQTGVIFDAGKAEGVNIKSIDDFTPSPDGNKLLVCNNTHRIYRHSYTADFYIYDVKTHHVVPLSANGQQQVPVWSPDSKKVAFVRNNNIFVVNVSDMKETQITTDGQRNRIINGIPDWVNEEEFGFSTAMAFSADSRNICWIRYDESNVETYSLQLFRGMKPERNEYSDYPGFYSYKYPKAGHDNALVSAWAHDISNGTLRQVNLPMPHEGYIPRIFTGKEGTDVVLYTMNRHQDSLCVYSASAATGQCRRLYTESVPKYVKEEAMEGIIFLGKNIIVPSDRSGTMQIYLIYDNYSKTKRLTNAKYGVTEVYGYDEATQKLYYQAAGVSPTEREIYVSDKNGKTKVLANRKGWNKALFSSDYKYYVLTWSDMNTPYECDVFDISGKKLRSVVDNKRLKERLAGIDAATKEMFSFTTSEGVTLNGWMVKPPHFDQNKKYPVIMFQYSGPGNQQVVNSWSIGSMGQGAMFDQFLAQQGFIVACTDGRGTGGRGAEFEKCTYMQLGELEARDQVETAIYLSKLPYTDPERIGIWGWSFGGFCTLMSMSEGRGVFRAGVAVAPPTNWKFYDTIYTERYMRTPQENPDGYDTNPTIRAAKLHGALLICHGLADDNVHPQNTFEYSEALVQADKDFRQVIYTNRNHSIYGGNTRNHLLRQITNFFKDNL